MTGEEIERDYHGSPPVNFYPKSLDSLQHKLSAMVPVVMLLLDPNPHQLRMLLATYGPSSPELVLFMRATTFTLGLDTFARHRNL